MIHEVLYKGELLDGKATGRGGFVTSDGNVKVTSHFVNDMMEGFGVFASNTPQNLIMDGEWREDDRFGKMTFNDEYDGFDSNAIY